MEVLNIARCVLSRAQARRVSVARLVAEMCLPWLNPAESFRILQDANLLAKVGRNTFKAGSSPSVHARSYLQLVFNDQEPIVTRTHLTLFNYKCPSRWEHFYCILSNPAGCNLLPNSGRHIETRSRLAHVRPCMHVVFCFFSGFLMIKNQSRRKHVRRYSISNTLRDGNTSSGSCWLL